MTLHTTVAHRKCLKIAPSVPTAIGADLVARGAPPTKLGSTCRCGLPDRPTPRKGRYEKCRIIQINDVSTWPEAIFHPDPRVSAAEGPAEKVRRQGLFFHLLGWCRRGSLVSTASILTRSSHRQFIPAAVPTRTDRFTNQRYPARLKASETVPTRMRLTAQAASRLNQLRDTNLRPR